MNICVVGSGYVGLVTGACLADFGMHVVGVDKDALLVPTASVQHGQKGLYVYVVDDQNRAAMRPVTVSHENTVNSVVTQGVKEGDRVVTVGQFLLQPGTAVAIDATANGS